MPKDKRLYMTFPNDFPEHPKIKPLSDAAFRVFVEMNGYSRTQDLDGRVPVPVAKAKWKARALTELQNNHPERPTLTVENGEFVIRDYAEHQQTKSARAELVARNKENGSKGGRPRKNNPEETQSVSEPKPNQKHSQSQSQRSELNLTDISEINESSQVSDGPVSAFDGLDDVVRQRSVRAGVGDLSAVRRRLADTTGEPVSWRGAVELVEAILSKAKRSVRDTDAYIATVCRNTPAEVQQAYFDLDIGGVA
jgi:hypothetical protein